MIRKYKSLIIVCVALTLILIAYGKIKKEYIVLPPIENIESVKIISEEGEFTNSNKEEIAVLLENMKVAKATNRKSVQDVPNVDEYMKIELICSNEVVTTFIYSENDDIYLEQPYIGIYSIDKNHYEKTYKKTSTRRIVLV